MQLGMEELMFRIERNVDYLLVGGVVKACLGAAVDLLTASHLSYYYWQL